MAASPKERRWTHRRLRRALLQCAIVIGIVVGGSWCAVVQARMVAQDRALHWLAVEGGVSLSTVPSHSGLASLTFGRRVYRGIEFEGTITYEAMEYAKGLRASVRTGYSWRLGALGFLGGIRAGGVWRRSVHGSLGTLSSGAWMLGVEPEFRWFIGERLMLRMRLSTPVAFYHRIWLAAFDLRLGVGLCF